MERIKPRPDETSLCFVSSNENRWENDSDARDYLFTYHREDGSISCNFRHLVSSVPAGIFRHLLIEHLFKGREDFEYREFKRIRELFPNPKRTNFEVRFQRLLKILDAYGGVVKIKKMAPGRFVFRAVGNVSFSED